MIHHCFQSPTALRLLGVRWQGDTTISTSSFAPDTREEQCLWLTSGIAANFFATGNLKRARQNLKSKSRQNGVQETHRKLWPGIGVPSICPVPGAHQRVEECMPTSLLFAYIGLMISNEKRKREDRMRAHEFLKALIDRMAHQRSPRTMT